jgi:hypothetical protein
MGGWEPDLDPRQIERDRAKAEEALRRQREFYVSGTSPGFVARTVGGFFRFVVAVVVLLVVGLVIAAATGNLDAIRALLGR